MMENGGWLICVHITGIKVIAIRGWGYGISRGIKEISCGMDNINLKFFKKYSIIAYFKAFNERISEWAYFLNQESGT